MLHVFFNQQIKKKWLGLGLGLGLGFFDTSGPMKMNHGIIIG